MKIFRICLSRHANDLKGIGAFKVGGRWNSKGRYMLYTASSISLSMLEVLAHFSIHTKPNDLSLITIEIPDDSIQTKSLKEFDPEWSKTPVSFIARKIGDKWLDNMHSLAIEVPSVINKHEKNILINPNHPRFSEVKIIEIEPWPFDIRLIK